MMTRPEYDKYIDSLKGMSQEEAMESLLANLALIQPQMMLQDLLFGERTPALHNAITALLKYHKIEFPDASVASRKDHPVGALAHGMPPADYVDGTEYGMKH